MKEFLTWIDNRIRLISEHAGLRKWQYKAIKELIQAFLEGEKIVVVSLPTGYGKTLIGISPLLYQLYEKSFEFSSWLCYVLPMRVLCNSLYEDVKRKYLRDMNVEVNVFHGGVEQAEELFSDDLAITTFDTFTLSYARRTIGGYHMERPAGFISTSCITFDEAHMIQDEYFYSFSLMKAIMERLYKIKVPMLVMTATMPTKVRNFLFENLETLNIPESPTEFKERPEEYRGRFENAEFTEDKSITKLLKDAEWRRALVVCNTVERAAKYYDEFSADSETCKILIHSRLANAERVARENYIKKHMSSQEAEGKRIVVFATQVVEAGIDISADLLISELAPADSLVQRAGRCARFKGEKGYMYIVNVEDPNPYPHDLIEQTREEVKKRHRDGRLVDSLMNLVEVQDFVDSSYSTFDHKSIEGKKEMSSIVAYLKGRGLLTFTVDWNLIGKIRTRRETQITLVAPTTIKIRRVERERVLEEHGLLRYKYCPDSQWSECSTEGVLCKLVDSQRGKRELLAIDVESVKKAAFSVSLEKLGKVPRCLIYKGHIFELRSCSMYEGKRRDSKAYVIVPKAVPKDVSKVKEGAIKEGIYIVNPDYYDMEKGLVKL